MSSVTAPAPLEDAAVANPPHAFVQNALERTVAAGLTSIGLVGAIVFGLFALLNLATAPPDELTRWVTADALTSAAFLAFTLVNRWRPVRAHGHAFVLGLSGLALANVVHALAYGGDAETVLFVMLLVIACGLLMLSWAWFLTASGAILGTWAIAATRFELAHLDVTHALLFPLAALALATLTHATRYANQRRMETMRWRDQRMSRELCEALLSVRQREERFRALVQNSTDVFSILAPDGTALYQSPSTKRVLGYAPEGLNGANMLDLVHPDDLARARTLLAETVEAPGESRVAELRFRCENGAWAHIESTAYAALDHPGIRGIVVNTRDISERKAATEALRRSEKLAALGTLIAGVAHEINNPLQFMKGNVELAQLTLSDLQARPDLRDEDRATLAALAQDHAVILEGTERIARITQGLRYVARSDHAGTRRPATLTAIVNGVLAATGKQLHGAPRVVTDLASSRTTLVNVDEVTQVLMNLVLNAAHAMADADERVLTIRTRDEGARVVLEVTDTGCGIAEHLRPHLFTPFHTTKTEGTGLGLSICHGIVTSHEGELTFTSRPGETTFRVTLPANDPEDEAAAE